MPDKTVYANLKTAKQYTLPIILFYPMASFPR